MAAYLKSDVVNTVILYANFGSSPLSLPTNAIASEFVRMSTVFAVPESATQCVYGVQDIRSSGFTPVQFTKPIIINLTSTFGAGNEPTAAQMDAILAFYPNSWFDGTVNLGQNAKLVPYLLNTLRAKADAAQEAWITPTLINGWVQGGDSSEDNVSYYKDTFGVVRFRGLMRSGTIGQSAFTLPNGYRPPRNKRFAVVSNNVFGAVQVSSGGVVTPVAGASAWMDLDGIAFRVEV